MHYEFTKALTDLKQEDIQQLIGEGTAESKYIEYKAQMYDRREHGRKELCKDLSAFANAGGGDLVIGVRESDDEELRGKPEEIVAITGESFDDIRVWIQQIADAHVQPRLMLDFKEIEVAQHDAPAGFVLVVRVAHSFTAPHMVKFEHQTKFFVRASGQVVQIEDVHELRQAFVASEALEHRIRDWRLDRLARIISSETPAPIKSSDCVVIHLIPVIEYATSARIPIYADKRTLVLPFDSGTSPWINFEGKLFPTHPFPGPHRGYVQLFRSGMIEGVRSGVVHDIPSGENTRIRLLNLDWVEDLLMQSVPDYVELLLRAGASFPMMLLTALLDVKGTHDPKVPHYDLGESVPNNQRNLLLPSAQIDTDSFDIDETMRPVFDAMWNAVGRERSPNYDKDGHWIRRR